MTMFVTGGCKNGKSTFALHQAVRLAGAGPRYYIATLAPKDDEQWACVYNHQAARKGMDFVTIECPAALPPCPAEADPTGVFLLDSVTALLANEMFSASGDMDMTAAGRIIADLGQFLDTVRDAVIVSDYIYADGVEYGATSDAFVEALARIDCFLAKRCDCVVEICAGIPTFHKGTSVEKQEGLRCI